MSERFTVHQDKRKSSNRRPKYQVGGKADKTFPL